MKKYTIELTKKERDLLVDILSRMQVKEDNSPASSQGTIMDWLYELQDVEVRKRAIQLCDPTAHEITASSLDEALKAAFFWETTPEGHDYWHSIYNELRNTTK